MAEVHRILVVDDDPVIREAYRGFFGAQDDFALCGEARHGAEGVTAYASLLPDLVLMDLQMPVQSGVDATAEICRRWPTACVVAMTTFSTQAYVVAALRAGAAGYLLKDVGGPGLIAGLRQALAGEMPLSSSVRRELVATVRQEPPARPGPADLGITPREVELLGWLAQGLSNAQIGRRMYISEGTVKQHLSKIGRTLGVSSRTGILVEAIRSHLVAPPEHP